MSKKLLEGNLSVVIVVSALMVVAFAYTRFFITNGSYLSQGYIGPNGDINGNNWIFLPIAMLDLSIMVLVWKGTPLSAATKRLLGTLKGLTYASPRGYGTLPGTLVLFVMRFETEYS